MNNTGKVIIIMRVIIALWFILINIFILIPSFQILTGIGDNDLTSILESMNPPAPPAPPVQSQLGPTPSAEQVNAYKQQVDAYGHQVTAYTQQVNAYKSHLETAAKSDKIAKYKAVVTDTLVVILNGFIAAFLGWVFANITAGAAKRFTELKRAQAKAIDSDKLPPLDPIKLL